MIEPGQMRANGKTVLLHGVPCGAGPGWARMIPLYLPTMAIQASSRGRVGSSMRAWLVAGANRSCVAAWSVLFLGLRVNHQGRGGAGGWASTR
jgi:hypothetical protein